MSLVAPKQPMKERILDTADRLFYQRGIRAVGVDTIAAEVGISKRTLYNHFPSKDGLVAAYLMRRFVPIPHSEKSPLDQIMRTFERLAQGFASKGFRGCPFVNAVTEIGESDTEARKIALAFKEDRIAWMRDKVTKLGVPDPETLATQLAILIDGAIAQDLVRRDPEVGRKAQQAARVLLAHAGVTAAAAAS